MTWLSIFVVCRDDGEILAEALKIMLCVDRQHDMQRAAAFIKRLATFCLCSGSAESLAGNDIFCLSLLNCYLFLTKILYVMI